MTWADFYLICFAVGFLFSLLSFLAGGMRWHLHPPHFLHGHVAMPHVGGGHGAPAGHAPAHPTSPGQEVAMDQTVKFRRSTSSPRRRSWPGLGGWISPYPFFRCLVCHRVGLCCNQRSGRRRDCVSLSQPGADFAGRKHGPRRLRNDWRAGQSLGFDPRGWYGRNHLLAGRYTAQLRCSRSRCGPGGEGNRSDGHTLRERNCLRTPMVRGIRRGRVNVGATSGS